MTTNQMYETLKAAGFNVPEVEDKFGKLDTPFKKSVDLLAAMINTYKPQPYIYHDFYYLIWCVYGAFFGALIVYGLMF